MSSTYVSGYRAHAFATSTGYGYVMQFETCESNVCPRVPRWRANYVADLPATLAWISEYAYCCDDGMTRGARGVALRGETFIERSEQALQQAKLLTGPVVLTFGPSFSEISEKVLPVFEHLVAETRAAVRHIERPGCRAAFELDMVSPRTGDLFLALSTHVHASSMWRDKHPDTKDGPGAWQPTPLQPTQRAEARAAAAAFLDGYRFVRLRGQPEQYTTEVTTSLVTNLAGEVMSDSPMSWFCDAFLQQVARRGIGVSLVALTEFRRRMKSSEVFQAKALESTARLKAGASAECQHVFLEATGARSVAAIDALKAWSLRNRIFGDLQMQLQLPRSPAAAQQQALV